MANKKISELDELTSVVNADVVLINDADASTATKSKWATIANVMATAPVQSVAGQTGVVVTLDYTTDLINTPTTITGGQASAITANTAKVTFPGIGTSGTTAMAGNTALLTIGTTNTTALAGDTAILTIGTSGTTAMAGNTALLQIGTSGTTALAGDTALLTIGTSGTTAMAGNTALLQIGTGAGDALAGNTTILSVGTGAGDALAGNTTLLALGTSGTDALAGDTTLSNLTGTVPVASGGTGATSQQGALDALTGSGTNTHVLTLTGGTAGWAASSGGGGGGGGAYTINNKTADYIVASGDLGEVITVDGTYTVTIPATGISAGFYCTVVNLGTGIVTIAAASGAYLYNRKHHFRLNGKGTSARIVCYAEDYYSLEGDVTGIDGLYLDVPSDPLGNTSYFNADDNSNTIYSNSTTMTPGDAHWGTQEYLKITGDDITGNYKRYVGADGESGVTTDIDSAFTSASGAMLPTIIDGDMNGSYVWDNGSSSAHTDGLYVYCGTGDTPTAFTVNDNNGAITDGGDPPVLGIEILPVIYYVPSGNQSSLPMWALSLYYDYGGIPTESGDASGSGVVSQYAVAWWNPRGAGDRVEMSGHQSGANAQAWNAYDVPKGYVYFS